MEIQSEAREPFSIRSYDSKSVMIGQDIYHYPCWVHKDGVEKWTLAADIKHLTFADLTDFLGHAPDIILIGQTHPQRPPQELIVDLAQRRIGLEVMSIGAACRTFNILLSEGRKIILGLTSS